VKPGPREVEGLLWTNGAVSSEILPVDKYNTFTPALQVQHSHQTVTT
jgi:hypothetical protein